MSKLSGIFERFTNLDQLNAELVVRWLPFKAKPVDIENIIANRRLYPQAIPVSVQEMEVDLAILREAIRLNPHLVYNHNLRKISITEDFVVRFTPLNALITAIIDGLDLEGVNQLLIRKPDASTSSGSIIIPTELPKSGNVTIEIDQSSKEYALDTIAAIPLTGSGHEVKIGKHSYQAHGGDLGVLVDLRRIKHDK